MDLEYIKYFTTGILAAVSGYLTWEAWSTKSRYRYLSLLGTIIVIIALFVEDPRWYMGLIFLGAVFVMITQYQLYKRYENYKPVLVWLEEFSEVDDPTLQKFVNEAKRRIGAPTRRGVRNPYKYERL